MAAGGWGIARRRAADVADEGGDGGPPEVSPPVGGIVRRCGQGGGPVGRPRRPPAGRGSHTGKRRAGRTRERTGGGPGGRTGRPRRGKVGRQTVRVCAGSHVRGGCAAGTKGRTGVRPRQGEDGRPSEIAGGGSHARRPHAAAEDGTAGGSRRGGGIALGRWGRGKKPRGKKMRGRPRRGVHVQPRRRRSFAAGRGEEKTRPAAAKQGRPAVLDRTRRGGWPRPNKDGRGGGITHGGWPRPNKDGRPRGRSYRPRRGDCTRRPAKGRTRTDRTDRTWRPAAAEQRRAAARGIVCSRGRTRPWRD